jgi:glycosyltransferase involved in cell wall biosynthesis
MQDDSPIQSWSIIVLCYNEAGNIERVVGEVQDVLKIIAPGKSEIVLVNDGSSDNSLELIEAMVQLPQNSNINFVNHSRNMGIGEALHSGYFHAQYENVTILPGDGQFDAKELIPFKSIPPKTLISFYRKENTIYSVLRNVLSLINKKLNEWFLGLALKDVNWVNVYKNPVVKTLDLEIRSSLVESEICSKVIYLGHNVIQVESKYLPRQAGASKGSSFKIVMQAVKDIIRLIFVFRRFKKRIKKENKLSKTP